MSKPENTFIARIHRLLPPKETLYRMKNNNLYNAGIADCWYSGPRADLWVEYKYRATMPKRGLVVPDLTDLQDDWLTSRASEGRYVLVIYGCPQGGVIYPAGSWGVEVPAKKWVSMVQPHASVALTILKHCCGP